MFPLKGKGLKQVNGKECSNRLFATTPIKQPLVAKGVSAQSPKLQKVYEYDIETKAGKSYIVNTIERKTIIHKKRINLFSCYIISQTMLQHLIVLPEPNENIHLLLGYI